MPKLTDFDPKWVNLGERKGLGFTYRCTTGHCRGRCLVLFSNPLDGGEPYTGDTWTFIEQMQLAESFELHRGCGVYRWHREGDTFETLTLSPSVNAHECGHFTVVNGSW